MMTSQSHLLEIKLKLIEIDVYYLVADRGSMRRVILGNANNPQFLKCFLSLLNYQTQGNNSQFNHWCFIFAISNSKLVRSYERKINHKSMLILSLRITKHQQSLTINIDVTIEKTLNNTILQFFICLWDFLIGREISRVFWVIAAEAIILKILNI